MSEEKENMQIRICLVVISQKYSHSACAEAIYHDTTFWSCRMHLCAFPDNLSRNSCIFKFPSLFKKTFNQSIFSGKHVHVRTGSYAPGGVCQGELSVEEVSWSVRNSN